MSKMGFVAVMRRFGFTQLVAHLSIPRHETVWEIIVDGLKSLQPRLVVTARNCYLILVDFRTLLVILFGIILPALFIAFYLLGP